LNIIGANIHIIVEASESTVRCVSCYTRHALSSCLELNLALERIST